MAPRALCICVLGMAVVAFPTAAQNLVTNGSFEDPAFPDGFNYPVTVTSWSVSPDPGVEIWHITHTAGYAADGVQLLELEGVQCDTVSQSIATDPGRVYVLRFAYSARPGGFSGNQMEIRWNGQLLGTVSANTIASGNPIWTYHTFQVVGVSGSSTLAFTATGTCDGAGSFLDDVSLVEYVNVPALGGAGLAMLVAVLAVAALLALRRH